MLVYGFKQALWLVYETALFRGYKYTSRCGLEQGYLTVTPNRNALSESE